MLEDFSAGPLADEAHAKKLQAALKRYCHALTKSRWDAEDLAQDTWIKALQYLKAPGHTNPEALLLRIARNMWIDSIRRQAVLTRLLKLEPTATEAEVPEQTDLALEAAFQALWSHLPPLQRTVFLLRDVLGHSASEAAELLGTTEGAVKSALYRARQALPAVRQQLEAGDSPLPEETEQRELLHKLAAAYEQGQLAELIRLAREDEQPVLADANGNGQQIALSGFPAAGWSGQPEMRMAA